MNVNKKIIVSAVISFIISTLIFISTFNIFGYYSLILSYVICGTMLFLFFSILFTKEYKREKIVKWQLQSMLATVTFAL
ncbi:MAG: hypothetical protein IJ809_01245 [Clostridia bacterium]|nr:hypothetical protein [Clostridia bacterium]